MHTIMHISLLQKYHLELLGGLTLSHEKAHLVTLVREKNILYFKE